MPRKPIKRAIWARQPRKDRGDLIAKYRLIEVGKDARTLSLILGSKESNLKADDIKSFLIEHRGEARGAIRNMAISNNYTKILGKIGERDFVTELLNSGVLAEGSLKLLAREVASSLVHKEITKLVDKVQKNLDKFIKARNIPYNRKVFEEAFSKYLSKDVPHSALLKGIIDPTRFESVYLAELKDFRKKVSV